VIMNDMLETEGQTEGPVLRSITDGALSKIDKEISILESKLAMVLSHQPDAKKDVGACKTKLLHRLDGIYRRLVELNSRISL